jgi:mitogen-activated protein kinase organizer 1
MVHVWLCLVSMGKDSGEVLNTYDSKHHTAGTYGLDCAITATDESIVSGSEDGNVVLYDLVDGSMSQILVGPTKPTCSVAAHPKRASVLLSASYDGNAVVWSNPSEICKWDR